MYQLTGITTRFSSIINMTMLCDMQDYRVATAGLCDMVYKTILYGTQCGTQYGTMCLTKCRSL